MSRKCVIFTASKQESKSPRSSSHFLEALRCTASHKFPDVLLAQDPTLKSFAMEYAIC